MSNLNLRRLIAQSQKIRTRFEVRNIERRAGAIVIRIHALATEEIEQTNGAYFSAENLQLVGSGIRKNANCI